MSIRFIPAAVAVLSAAACAGSISAISGPVEIGTAYTVTLERDWNLIRDSYDGKRTRGDRLTQDGPALNIIYLVGGLKDGQYILKPPRKEFPTPIFRSDMSELERIEFVTDTLAAYGYEHIETQTVEPENFGNAEGIAMGLSAVTTSGLRLKGNVLMTSEGNTLNYMVFIAPEAHYYNAYTAEVLKIFGSAQLVE